MDAAAIDLGISATVFLEMTPRELQNMYQHKYITYADKWEQLSILQHSVVAPHMKDAGSVDPLALAKSKLPGYFDAPKIIRQPENETPIVNQWENIRALRGWQKHHAKKGNPNAMYPHPERGAVPVKQLIHELAGEENE